MNTVLEASPQMLAQLSETLPVTRGHLHLAVGCPLPTLAVHLSELAAQVTCLSAHRLLSHVKCDSGQLTCTSRHANLPASITCCTCKVRHVSERHQLARSDRTQNSCCQEHKTMLTGPATSHRQDHQRVLHACALPLCIHQALVAQATAI